MSRSKAPYKELDSNIVSVCKALNSFPGLNTIGSCGGHRNPKPYQLPGGHWEVLFIVYPNADGWYALEFLAWLINNDYQRSGKKIHLDIFSAPPYLNFPGETVKFIISASGFKPDVFASELREYKRIFYISPKRNIEDS